MDENKSAGAVKAVTGNSEPVKCGIVMPIAAMGDYSELHWTDVLDIVQDAVSSAGFEANLVSYAEESALIHSTIVQNLFDNPIVICDVSGKNPNVMFELGLRLAFDKPTIVIKDDATGYSFDTTPVEHITYPRDLRFGKIVAFKRRLAEKASATHKKSLEDPSYSTFLKHFNKVTVAKLDEREVTGQEFLLEELKAIRTDISRMERQSNVVRQHTPLRLGEEWVASKFMIGSIDEESLTRIRRVIRSLAGVKRVKVSDENGRKWMEIEVDEDTPRSTREAIAFYQAEIRKGWTLNNK